MKNIIRVSKKENPFAQIDKRPINEKRLSWKARGILCYLLSKPDDWQVNVWDLIKQSEKDGEAAVRSALKEMRQLGYMVLKSKKNKVGKIEKWEYIIYENPVGDFPQVEFPQVDFPQVENQGLNNNELDNNNDLRNNNELKDAGQSPAPLWDNNILKEYLEKMSEDKRKAIRIIRNFFIVKGVGVSSGNIQFKSKIEIQAEIDRNLRPANRLAKGYCEERIFDVMNLLQEFATDFVWTLETVEKKIAFSDEEIKRSLIKNYKKK